MKLKLKICGMRAPDNIREVAAMSPDFLGFIFFEGSARNVSEEIPSEDSKIKKTGVFVNASEEDILKKVEKYKLEAVQLHGDESEQFCENLKSSFSEVGKKVVLIKVFSIENSFDFTELEPYEQHVDLFLFDTHGKHKGGNGLQFNWEVLENYTSSTPFILSGGIGPNDVPAIKEFYTSLQKRQKEHLFYGIDVNSKFETAPAEKNAAALKLFIQQLNQ